MSEYIESLEAVIRREWLSATFWIIALCAVIALIWISNFVYHRKRRKKDSKKYNSSAEIKKRRAAIWASAALTAIAVALGALTCADALMLIPDIKKDISDQSFSMYSGYYYVHTAMVSNAYNKWIGVDFGNGDRALIYVDSLVESAVIERGDRNGTVIYGKNSGIVVEMK